MEIRRKHSTVRRGFFVPNLFGVELGMRSLNHYTILMVYIFQILIQYEERSFIAYICPSKAPD